MGDRHGGAFGRVGLEFSAKLQVPYCYYSCLLNGRKRQNWAVMSVGGGDARHCCRSSGLQRPAPCEMHPKSGNWPWPAAVAGAVAKITLNGVKLVPGKKVMLNVKVASNLAYQAGHFCWRRFARTHIHTHVSWRDSNDKFAKTAAHRAAVCRMAPQPLWRHTY